MSDPTIEMAERMIGEQETRKLIEEIKKSGVRHEDSSFALATRVRQMQSPMGFSAQAGAEMMPSRPANWGVPPTPTGAQLPPGAQVPPQPIGPAPEPPTAVMQAAAAPRGSNVESPLGPPPITAQTGYYREEGSSDTRRR